MAPGYLTVKAWPQKKRLVFEKGILKTYYIDTYYGKKLEMAPTSGGTTNLVFETGNKDLEGLIKSTKKRHPGKRVQWGQLQWHHWRLFLWIEGFLVEDGKITKPVSEMNITGNMKELWMNLAEVGSDVHKTSSWLTPSLLFNNVAFSGA